MKTDKIDNTSKFHIFDHDHPDGPCSGVVRVLRKSKWF